MYTPFSDTTSTAVHPYTPFTPIAEGIDDGYSNHWADTGPSWLIQIGAKLWT